jgi:hypothetical protein
MEQLTQALIDYLGPLVDLELVFMDKPRLNPGYNNNEALAEAICESVCMIVVFSPLYEERSYCLREFLAMECIEEKRKQMLGEKYDRKRRMIIQFVVRGKAEDLPPKIKDIQYKDYSEILLATFTRDEEFDKTINTIADDIHEYYKDLKALNEECISFKLPPEEEARRSWIKSTISM